MNIRTIDKHFSDGEEKGGMSMNFAIIRRLGGKGKNNGHSKDRKEGEMRHEADTVQH